MSCSRSAAAWCCWCARRRCTPGHLRTMAQASEMGAIVMPPVPAFYAQPQSDRRHHRPYRGTRPRPVRHRHRPGQALGRAGLGAAGALSGAEAMTTTAQTDLQLDGPHWAFALDFYQRPGVADACLVLQDHAGVDVTFLLFALYVADSHRVVLEQADLERLDQAVAAWREAVVRPLRQLRRRLKGGPQPAPGTTSACANASSRQSSTPSRSSWRYLRAGSKGNPAEPRSKPADAMAALEGVMALCRRLYRSATSQIARGPGSS